VVLIVDDCAQDVVARRLAIHINVKDTKILFVSKYRSVKIKVWRKFGNQRQKVDFSVPLGRKKRRCLFRAKSLEPGEGPMWAGSQEMERVH
jgi:hypothetical protein